MSNSRASLAQVIREVVAEDRGKAGPPPSAEEMVAYAAGELSGGEAERIAERILASPESRNVVLGLKSFPRREPPSEQHRITGEELDKAWSRMQTELGIAGVCAPREVAKPAAPRPVQPPAPERDETAPAPWLAWLRASWMRPILSPAMIPAALAASFILGIFSASAWHEEAPRLNVEVLDLVPKSQVLRSGSADLLSLSEGAASTVLILSLSDLVDYSAYVVEIVDARDKVVWSSRGTRRTSAGYLTVTIPQGFLVAGRYDVRLFDVGSDPRRLVEEYPLQVQP